MFLLVISRRILMTIKKPSYHKNEEFINRSKKLKELKDLGIDPYPYKYDISHTIKNFLSEYKDRDIGHSEDAFSGSTDTVKIAGRLVLFRAMGKNAFAQIQDESGRVQIMLNRDHTTMTGFDAKKTDFPNALKFIEKKIDLGDIIGIDGNVFKTQKGEITVLVKELSLLCKSLLPLPDKHSGLADKGVRYRKRWLDLIARKDVLDTFIMRSKIIKIVRNYLDDLGFLEVETPVLQKVYGGAEAKPFKTHLNALHQDMFLRICIELPLKELLVGGMLRVYELGRAFRNEGIDKTHNPEFTSIEAYAAYLDYNDVMEIVENLFETVALKLFNDTKIKFKDHVIDVKTPWIRISMKDSIKKYANIDVDSLSVEELKEKLKGKIEASTLKNLKRGELMALIFEEFVEEHLIQPHHITDHPIETTPLCKLHRNPKEREQGIVERFESFILAREMVNAYSELNDPELQRKLLEDQASRKEKEKAHPLDEDFVEAICQGMPPAGGFGLGIDRMVMLFTKSESIKDVIYFPLMKGEEH
jgi:lysyl-tRNA synthetase class 2